MRSVAFHHGWVSLNLMQGANNTLRGVLCLFVRVLSSTLFRLASSSVVLIALNIAFITHMLPSRFDYVLVTSF